MAELLAIDYRILLPYFNTWLASALNCAGALADALQTAEATLGINPEATVYRPETLRICGELRLQAGDAERAEAYYRESIALAKMMAAKAWELRTTASLARLLASEHRPDEAHAMLAEIYNWFTEGFDTPDLKEAKALLEQLGPPAPSINPRT